MKKIRNRKVRAVLSTIGDWLRRSGATFIEKIGSKLMDALVTLFIAAILFIAGVHYEDVKSIFYNPQKTVEIIGCIEDFGTLLPIEGARVFVEQHELEAITDENGEYRIVGDISRDLEDFTIGVEKANFLPLFLQHQSFPSDGGTTMYSIYHLSPENAIEAHSVVGSQSDSFDF